MGEAVIPATVDIAVLSGTQPGQSSRASESYRIDARSSRARIPQVDVSGSRAIGVFNAVKIDPLRPVVFEGHDEVALYLMFQHGAIEMRICCFDVWVYVPQADFRQRFRPC